MERLQWMYLLEASAKSLVQHVAGSPPRTQEKGRNAPLLSVRMTAGATVLHCVGLTRLPTPNSQNTKWGGSAATRSHSGRTVQSGPQSGVALLQHSGRQSCWLGLFFFWLFSLAS